MAFKNLEQRKDYHKKYYKEHKGTYAYYKRYAYWIKMYSLMVDESIESLRVYSLEEIKEFVKTIREAESKFK
jgi:hypothetical protein